jgi:hypothetical protein
MPGIAGWLIPQVGGHIPEALLPWPASLFNHLQLLHMSQELHQEPVNGLLHPSLGVQVGVLSGFELSPLIPFRIDLGGRESLIQRWQ